MEPSGFGCMKHGVLAASVSCLQSADSPMHNSGVFGHIFDVSLSGRSYTYTFSSSEVSLSSSSSFPSSPLMSDVTVFFLLPSSPLSFFLNHFYFFNFDSPISFLRQTLDEDLAASNNNNMWQNRPVAEWSCEQVCMWLTAMSMDEYASDFIAKGVDGTELLLLDGEKLKVRENWSSPIFFSTFHVILHVFFYWKMFIILLYWPFSYLPEALALEVEVPIFHCLS